MVFILGELELGKIAAIRIILYSNHSALLLL
jgi:hypothetical protein